ncbi:50S ribosomal protein L15 [Candidatus Cerribacteria bacterium 'Amazon FNV 2010 28 9']|uniref:Large ribosomal subunit protein uL15 n=1 Tax=Candidatus Cerribacteria bacterium 'Amazon FNV 2010 28 9' TaxID=2081795 RepID=A0A317JQY7_9BACT|nr:MAG: 50S ribosomal protein L15 [Candidatus Cerribacteria bacterium 'Amazon FNV 2010 28 9']
MLHTLPKVTTNKDKRLGRGFGSGVGGHTVGRGTKGHRARQGKVTPLWFEGGQLPLIRRLPFMRGKARFQSLKPLTQEVQVEKLALLNGQAVTVETLFAAKLIRNMHTPVKVIGKGKVENVGEVRGVAMSASARVQIEKAGGKIA